jgi:hypothetical protein
MPDTENLGPPVTWTVRNVPTAIHDRVVAQVGRDETVADVLARLVLQGGHASDASANTSCGPRIWPPWSRGAPRWLVPTFRPG